MGGEGLTSVIELFLAWVLFKVAVELGKLGERASSCELSRSIHRLAPNCIQIIDSWNHRVNIRVFIPESIQIHLINIFLRLRHLPEISPVLISHRLLIKKSLFINILLVMNQLLVLLKYFCLSFMLLTQLILLSLLNHSSLVSLKRSVLSEHIIGFYKAIIDTSCLVGPIRHVCVVNLLLDPHIILFVHHPVCQLHVLRHCHLVYVVLVLRILLVGKLSKILR